MKQKILLLTILLFTCIAKAQFTFVPDDSFEARLQQLGLDSGPLDDLVLTANVSSLTEFEFGNFVVTDATGLQDFVSLTKLEIYEEITDLTPIENLVNLEYLVLVNTLGTSIDMTQFPNLDFVYIVDSAMEVLDFTNSPNISEVTIGNTPTNEIIFGNHPLLDDLFINYADTSELDLSGCTALKTLLVNNTNSMVNLDVSQCTLLETIEFDFNPLLTYIDLSNNTALISVRAEDNAALETIFIKNGTNTNIGQTFRVKDNPSLTCVEVDDVAWSNTFWGFATNYFPGFSAICSPSNDDCAQAVPITLVQPASGTTANATNSSNTPGCEENGITILDIWYEFPAPASGSVTMTINVPQLTGKIALYASCGDATPIACQENELAITGLTPNATYYLQVWLEADTANRNQNAVSSNETGGFILEVQDTATLSVNDFSTETNEIRMFPNPANHQVNVSAASNLEEITIYDMTGKRMLQNENLHTNSQTIQVDQLSSGMYMMQIKTATTTTLKKLIIN